MKIKIIIPQAFDSVTGDIYPEGTILDLGEDRNSAAIQNKFAELVEDKVKEEPVKATKKKVTPKKDK